MKHRMFSKDSQKLQLIQHIHYYGIRRAGNEEQLGLFLLSSQSFTADTGTWRLKLQE